MNKYRNIEIQKNRNEKNKMDKFNRVLDIIHEKKSKVTYFIQIILKTFLDLE